MLTTAPGDASHNGRVREWLTRYLPAESVGLVAAMVGGLLVHRWTASLTAAAVAGSCCETIGYYAVVAGRDVVRHYRALHRGAGSGSPRRRLGLACWRTTRDLLVEFGPAEVMDSVVLRPALMYAGPMLTGWFLPGLLLGKLLADVGFYALAVPAYEFRKRRWGVASVAPVKGGGS
jgi:hypothetical protein